MKNLVVGQKDFENKKLSVYLQHQFDGLSLNTIYKALRKKDIIVNGKRISENISVHQNDNITIYINDELLYKHFDLEIVYEDDNILVVNKPVGVEVVGDGNKNDLTTMCRGEWHSPGRTPYAPTPCHRLDMNTSGLVLFAKNKESLEILLEKFKNQEIEKHYLCTVYGIPKKEKDTITSYLFKDSKKSIVYISDEPKKGCRRIVTSYAVLDKNNFTNQIPWAGMETRPYITLLNDSHVFVLDVELHTGRTHQIRAHLAHIGLPIIGDGKYGINAINKKFKAKTQMLQAYKLKFNFKTDSGLLDYLNGKLIEI